MMLDYIWFALPISFFALLVLRPQKAPEDISTLDAHKERLKGLARDEERGILSRYEAEEARLEIQRRLLKAARTEDGLAFEGDGRLNRDFLKISALLLFSGAILFYAVTGSPTLKPARAALDSRLDQPLDDSANDMTLGGAIEALKAEVDRNPKSLEGWRLLAVTAESVGDFSTAAKAYGALADQSEARLENRLKQLQAMLALTQNQMTPAHTLLLEDIRQIEANHPAIDYYRGLVALQAGKTAEAFKIWRGLIKRSPQEAWYVVQLRQEFGNLLDKSAKNTDVRE